MSQYCIINTGEEHREHSSFSVVNAVTATNQAYVCVKMSPS